MTGTTGGGSTRVDRERRRHLHRWRLGDGGGTGPEPACHPSGGGKHNCSVWKTATSYNAPTPQGRHSTQARTTSTARRSCRRETSGRWTNVWWAKTDDDSGNANVFVSVVYIKGGDNDEPVPGLPVC